MNEKLANIDAKKDRISAAKADAVREALKREGEAKAAKEAAIIAKNTPPPAVEPEVEAEAEAEAETEGE